MERARHRGDALAPFGLCRDVSAGSPQTGSVGASESGGGLQPGLVSGIGRGGSRRGGPSLEQPSRNEGAVAVGIRDPDIPHQVAIRVAIGRLPFQPDLLALDQGRISGRRFGCEAGITGWRLQTEILHRLPPAADLDAEARAIEDVDDSGQEQIRRCGRAASPRASEGPRSIEV